MIDFAMASMASQPRRIRVFFIVSGFFVLPRKRLSFVLSGIGV